jgi:O-antigen/teichoic acid export membrane protein
MKQIQHRSMQITKKDVIWSYAATFMKIAASGLLLPFILKMMPSETVGIWSVFMTITTFTALLDFGFSPSFTRNVTYVFSGVRTLKVNGFETNDDGSTKVDYGLLKGVINAMRWFYLRMALVLFLLLFTIGTFYINRILKDYNGSHSEVFIAWIILCIISTYNLYTLYYDSLLQGKGLIKRSKQIIIIGQSVYLIIAAFLIIEGFGLVAIVTAQVASVVIIRWLAYRSFFTKELKNNLIKAIANSQKDVLEAITPNAIKVGLTSLGGFMVQKSAIIIGSLYLSLKDIASYGITTQLISIIAGLSGIYIATYQPKIVQLRIENNLQRIKELYLRGQLIFFVTYLAGGLCLIFFGEFALKLIGSQTTLLSNSMIIIASIVFFLETNHSIAANIIMTRNEVPFFKASLISGSATIILLLGLFIFFHPGVMVMILAPGIAQVAYQNWKWPLFVIKDLNITSKDIFESVLNAVYS